MEKKLTVKQFPNLNNLLVIKQENGPSIFLSTTDSVLITVHALASLLTFLLKEGMLSSKVLEAVLSDYYSFLEDTNE